MSAAELGPRRTILSGLHLPECPRWRDGRLWFSDMYGQTSYAVTEDGEILRRFPVEGRPGGIGFAANGDLLVNEMERARILRFDAEGGMRVHADLSALVPSINDMTSTPGGHCFVGRLTLAPPFEAAPLLSVTPDGQASVSASGPILVANGMVMQGAGRLIVAESVAGRLLSYDVAPNGALSNARVFAQLPDGLYADGICGDDAGGIWVATPHAGQFYRVEEGGTITHRVRLEPGRLAYACAIGGKDRRTLFLCTSGRYEPEIVSRDTAGCVEAVEAPYAATGTLP